MDWTVDPGGAADFTSIQDAIDAAADGDTIAVGPGTYAEAVDFRGKAVAVGSTDGAGVTILDGDGAEPNLVTFESGEGEGSVLRGFTLRNGGERAIYVSGAGPALEDLVVDEAGGVYGAGLYVATGTPTLTDSTFTDLDGAMGSDLYVDAGSHVVVSGCTFTGGISSEGAISVDGGVLELSDSAITTHWSSYGGALDLEGGAVATVRDTDFTDNDGYVNPGSAIQAIEASALEIDRGTFSGNGCEYCLYYTYTGGAVVLSGSSGVVRGATFTTNHSGYGAAIGVRHGGSLVVEDSRFEQNQAYGGLALAVDSLSDLVVTRSTFASNRLWSYTGSAIYASNANSVAVYGSTFCDNASVDGGAIYARGTVGATTIAGNVFHENAATGSGGAIALHDEPAVALVNNTFAGNEAGSGGAVLLSATSPAFRNNIVAWTAGGDGVYDATGDASAARITYNLWYANLAADVGGELTAADVSGGGNVAGDPLFVGFTADGACGDDLSIAASSPAIDAGDPSLYDTDGSRSDVGATGGGGDAPVEDTDVEDTDVVDTDTDTGVQDTGGAPEDADSDAPIDTPQVGGGCGGCATGGSPALPGVGLALLALRRRRLA